MRRIAAAVRWLLRSATSKVRLKFMVVLLGVLLPCSVVVYTTNLRAASNVITVNSSTDPANTSGTQRVKYLSRGKAIAVDSAGDAYVTREISSIDNSSRTGNSEPSGRSCCTGARILSPQLPLAGHTVPSA